MRQPPRTVSTLSGALATVLVLATSGGLVAQPAPEEAPAVVRALMGEWIGEGELLDQPSRFTMEWSQDEQGFVHLRYQPAFLDPSGGATPVMNARAIYRMEGEGLVGVWLDDRPARIELTAVIREDALATDWTAAFEEGRTVYQVVSENELVVTDWVRSSGELRKFGEARYRRR